jgi:hypothetical protein
MPRGKVKAEKEAKRSDMDEDEPKPAEQVDVTKSKKSYENLKSGVFHNVLDTPTQKSQKTAIKMLNASILKTPRYIKWSEKPIIWDRSNHPTSYPLDTMPWSSIR